MKEEILLYVRLLTKEIFEILQNEYNGKLEKVSIDIFDVDNNEYSVSFRFKEKE